jgi:2-polyprenyl-6-methoxyphenol hydroxylase-like FAD-dependent oxidoreductase
MKTGRVLVSGAGIAGLTLACALRRQGIDVDVIERKSEIGDEGGIGLTLVGNALRALQSIGLARPILDIGMPADHIDIATPDGQIVGQAPTKGPWGDGIPGHCSVARPALHRVLAEAARAAGASLRAGVEVDEAAADAEGLDVRLSDGCSARYALLVAAEGLNSVTRQRLFPGVGPVFSGQACWRARVTRPGDLRTTQIHFGGRYGVVGICPISQSDAYLYLVETAEANHREDPARLHLSLREKLDGHYGGRVAALLGELTDASRVNYSPLPVMLVPPPWHRARTVLIGDAAHANPPVLAQGAAMGIEDAVVLAEELGRDADVDGALQRFMTRRFERVRMVVETSRQLALWEVEQRRDVDVPGTMRRAAMALGEPI